MGDTESPPERTSIGAFVGRERELAELRAGLDDSVAGRGRLVLVSGEPGIGKTRLAEEISKDSAARGMRVVWGRCWEGGGAPAYWPWIQVIRGIVGEPEAPRARSRKLPAEIARMLPELASEAPAADPQGNAEQARFRLFDAVAALLRNSAREHPLLIVIDDLHEADLPSLQMLKFAVRVLHDAPVLIIGTYRDAEMRRSPERLRVIEEALRDGYQMPISGLAEAEVGRMVEARSEQSASAEFVAHLHRATAGNPLFVDGVLRVLAAEGRLGANQPIDPKTGALPTIRSNRNGASGRNGRTRPSNRKISHARISSGGKHRPQPFDGSRNPADLSPASLPATEKSPSGPIARLSSTSSPSNCSWQ